MLANIKKFTNVLIKVKSDIIFYISLTILNGFFKKKLLKFPITFGGKKILTYYAQEESFEIVKISTFSSDGIKCFRLLWTLYNCFEKMSFCLCMIEISWRLYLKSRCKKFNHISNLVTLWHKLKLVLFGVYCLKGITAKMRFSY